MRASDFAVAAHVHSQIDLADSGCQGTQTLEEVEQSALELGFRGVLLTPHSTNPAVGHGGRFASASLQAEALRRYFEDVRLMNGQPGVRFFAGLEANLLSDGIDTPPSVASQADFVIASIHNEVPANLEEVARRFQIACNNKDVDALGHPIRHLEDAMKVNWNAVLGTALETGTAIELNFNLWYTYLKTVEARNAHRAWLEKVADSGVLLLFSLDIHNAGMWPHEQPVESWSPTEWDVSRYITLLIESEIDFGRIVNRDVVDFSYLCDLPKEKRRDYRMS